MYDIALIPGAAHNASSMWPLQTRDDALIHPINYERGNFNRQTLRMPYVLQQYAVRVFEKVRALDRPLDLYAWSMGAPVSLGVAKIAEKHAPGLIRNIIMITPGVFHGSPRRNFHKTPAYAFGLMFPPVQKTLRRSAAIREIQQQLPEFNPEVADDTTAMMESGDGVMRIPNSFDRSRIALYYAPEDDIIPEDITLHVAKRAKITPVAVLGYGHELPLLDTDGSVLSHLRKEHP